MDSLLLLSILSFYGILIVAPPGFVFPIIWFVLFTLLGVWLYYLLNSG